MPVIYPQPFPVCLPFEIHIPVLFTEKKGRERGFRD